MTLDEKRLHYTYLLATLVLFGAFALLMMETPGITGGEKLAFIAGLTTGVVSFVFNREQSVGNARATERAIQQGAATANTTPTITTGNP